jgi:MFS family permease
MTQLTLVCSFYDATEGRCGPRWRVECSRSPVDTSAVAVQEARSPRTAFSVLAIGVFLPALDLFSVNIAFPAIQTTFPAASLSRLSWVLIAYAIVFAAVLVPAGKLADLVGRKPVFLSGPLVSLTGSALAAAAPSVDFLVGARILQALGGAALILSSLGLVRSIQAEAPSSISPRGYA